MGSTAGRAGGFVGFVGVWLRIDGINAGAKKTVRLGNPCSRRPPGFVAALAAATAERIFSFFHCGAYNSLLGVCPGNGRDRLPDATGVGMKDIDNA